MKSVFSMFVAAALFASAGEAIAAPKKFNMKGRGIDGSACAVQVIKSGDNQIQSIKLLGNAKKFHMKKTGFLAMPKTSLIVGGAPAVVEMYTKVPMLYASFQHKGNPDRRERYNFDSESVPMAQEYMDKNAKGANLLTQIDLRYRNGKLVEVDARTTIKATFFKVYEMTFACDI